MKIKFTITTEDELYGLAKKFANFLKGTETLALTGNLGSGKTAFVKKLGAVLGIKQNITSPTFNIHRRYNYDSNSLSHFDAYRLKAGELTGLEFEDLLGQELVAVEWADLVKKNMPKDSIWIDLTIKDESRIVTFDIPKILEAQFKKFQ